MKKYWRNLLILFVFFSIVKAIISYFTKSPSIFADEYIYFKAAFSSTYPPLYFLLTKLANNSYILIKILNAFVSSLIIFPAFFLAKDIMNEKRALFAAVCVSLLPPMFSFSSYIMAENLFYPLFLTSVYFIYKSFKEINWKYDLLAGIFTGLTILTKYLGFVLFALVIVLFLGYLAKKKEYSVKNKILYFAVGIPIACAWMIRNIFLAQSALSAYTDPKPLALPSFATWAVIYIGYAFLALTIFFLLFFAAKKYSKNQKLMNIITIILFIVMLAFIIKFASEFVKATTLFPWLLARPMGRYIAAIFPLFVIAGLANIRAIDKTKLKFVSLLLIPILIISSQLAFFSLFPMNNSSLTFYGLIIKYITTNILYTSLIFSGIFLIALLSSYFLILKLKPIQLKSVLLIMLILMSSLSCTAIYVNSKEWSENPNFQAGLYLSDIAKDKTVLIDVRDCQGYDLKNITNICSKRNNASLVGFWIKDLTFTEDNFDYVVSRHDLNHTLLREFDGTKIYEK